MAATKLKLGLATLIAAGAATLLVVQHQTQTRLREENQSLREQIAQLQAETESLSNRVARAKAARAPRLPAPPLQVTDQSNALPAEDLASTNLYARQDKDRKLTADQVEAFLTANRRNASSLLAAYRTSGDPALLAEAMQKFPDDPRVDFEAVFKPNASPEERRQALDAFKQSAPDNALANYLSALDYFKTGQTDQAVQELIAAAGKPQFQDYTPERYQDDADAYLAAGYSVAEAKAFASHQLPLPEWPELRQLGRDMVDLASSYRQAGDEASAQAALQMAVSLGQRLDGSAGEYLISQLVGMAVERVALSAMDPNSPYGSNGQTVRDRLNQIAQQKAALRELGQQADPLMQTMPDQDWTIYRDREMLFGEEAALQWVVSKYGQK